jgi:hypothetical protein
MTNALLSPAPLVESPEAADSRFFVIPEIVETPPVPSVGEVLVKQRNLARAALKTLDIIQTSRDVTQTAAVYPRLYNEHDIDEARFTIDDNGAIWRRQTDKISRNIAELLPNQILIDTAEAMHLSDGNKLYRVGFVKDQAGGMKNEVEVHAYTSLIDQTEFDRGMKLATEPMWQDLLANIVFTQAQ